MYYGNTIVGRIGPSWDIVNCSWRNLSASDIEPFVLLSQSVRFQTNQLYKIPSFVGIYTTFASSSFIKLQIRVRNQNYKKKNSHQFSPFFFRKKYPATDFSPNMKPAAIFVFIFVCTFVKGDQESRSFSNLSDRLTELAIKNGLPEGKIDFEIKRFIEEYEAKRVARMLMGLLHWFYQNLIHVLYRYSVIKSKPVVIHQRAKRVNSEIYSCRPTSNRQWRVRCSVL